MLLTLDDKFRVTCDSSKQNFQLEQLQEIKDRKSGETKLEWNIVGFHGNSLRSVLIQYKKISLYDDSLKTIDDVLDKLNEVERTIERVVKKQNIKLDVKSND